MQVTVLFPRDIFLPVNLWFPLSPQGAPLKAGHRNSGGRTPHYRRGHQCTSQWPKVAAASTHSATTARGAPGQDGPHGNTAFCKRAVRFPTTLGKRRAVCRQCRRRSPQAPGGWWPRRSWGGAQVCPAASFRGTDSTRRADPRARPGLPPPLLRRREVREPEHRRKRGRDGAGTLSANVSHQATKGHRALLKGQEGPPPGQWLLPEGRTWAVGVESDKEVMCSLCVCVSVRVRGGHSGSGVRMTPVLERKVKKRPNFIHTRPSDNDVKKELC